ncbi:SGNH/GDSL hydrolase family protein [Mesoplasma seiffertii]|uniref:SGNH/GDSL hydrolase family protein n=1 Tax=Mesoplasma seiffertii TaxID=28224 RepID=UPI00047A6F71|nr:SGNH/GDSL hydrolase family protein [Mesoplasma seiffertii]
MKRFLVISGTIILVLSPIAAVSACTIPQKQNIDFDRLVGLDIDKSQAIDDSTNTGMFTNFYTIGDSLSDTGGLTSALGAVLNANISFSDPSYHNSFTNGNTAAVNLAEKLGIEKFEAGFNYKLGQTTLNKHGKNYAIGGATAATAGGPMGAVVNFFKIQDQAESIIKQHQVKPTDLVLLEIGGNDLFGMMGTSDTNKAIKMAEAMENIKKAMLTLLNNGLTNIVVMNAPDISRIPTYNNKSEEVQQEARELSHEFNARFDIVFEEVNQKYNNSMQKYDLMKSFDEMLATYEKEGKNFKDAGTTTKFDLNTVLETGVIPVEYNAGVDEEAIKNYFFYDAVHPTKWAHQKVADDLEQLVMKWGNK